MNCCCLEANNPELRGRPWAAPLPVHGANFVIRRGMRIIALLLSLLFSGQIKAQQQTTVEEPENIVSLNLTGLIAKNFGVQYERILNRKSSIGLTVRFMPVTSLPFKNIARRIVAEEDPNIRETIEQLEVGNFAITPEYRLYLGKGYGKGFYLGPFYRYAHFKTNNVIITYDSDIFGNEEEVILSGDLNSHTIGIIVGAQWNLGKNFFLNWNIAGPHIGSGVGDLDGFSTRPLSPGDQQRVREELEKLDIPFTRKTITVREDGANMKLNGPWGGVRFGLSLGIGF